MLFCFAFPPVRSYPRLLDPEDSVASPFRTVDQTISTANQITWLVCDEIRARLPADPPLALIGGPSTRRLVC